MNNVLDNTKQNNVLNGSNYKVPELDFELIYNRSRRLAMAVFMVANLMDDDGELRSRLKKMSLELASLSINLKDSDLSVVSNSTSQIKKKSLELVSLLEIASISGFISKMNAEILNTEFQSFISELTTINTRLQETSNASVKGVIFDTSQSISGNLPKSLFTNSYNENAPNDASQLSSQSAIEKGENKNLDLNPKRKSQRRVTILDFIKGHDNVSIKDIVPNIVGCSEKTIQRELIELINEGKIRKLGERRWSRYSII